MPEPLLSDEARADLRNILRAVAANNGETVAERIIRDLFEAMQRIATFPGIGQRHSLLPDPSVRVLNHGQWRIIYQRRDDTVEVLHVLDAAQDLGTVFFS